MSDTLELQQPESGQRVVMESRSDEQTKLRVRGLRKTYGAVTALEGADLDLKKGEFVTLLGPSGSGKTTLLMAVAGLSEPDAGEIWIDGKLATYLPAHKRDLGMVFQNYALFPHMSIAENIAFPLKMRKFSAEKIQSAVSRALALVHLSSVAHRLPTQLSGGQQQRIAVARALVYEPSIILMDEPLGALDKNLRDDMQLEIKHLHEQLGGTFLYVTHDQEEALTMSDRVCLMNHARIEQFGTPHELYFSPATLFAAKFIGESNVLRGVVGRPIGESCREIHVYEGCVLTAKTSLPAGHGVNIVIRPEWLSPEHDALHLNKLVGEVLEVILSGAVTKAFVKLPNDSVVKVSCLTSPASHRFHKGDVVTLSCSSDSALIFDEITGKRA
ncbi:ABC transporter ATP-binding protein [Caballeronia glebae]|uniref:ABC transporter ATP-binding protein n=1 Tax=Caballeronia glebae TaxID=1777143 RepID=UPI0038BCA7D1